MNKFFEVPKKLVLEEIDHDSLKVEKENSVRIPIFIIDNDIYYNVTWYTRIPLCIVCMQKVADYSYNVNPLDDLANFPVCKKHDTIFYRNIFPIIWHGLEFNLLNQNVIFQLLRNNKIATNRLKYLLRGEVASFGYCDLKYTMYLLEKTRLEDILK